MTARRRLPIIERLLNEALVRLRQQAHARAQAKQQREGRPSKARKP